MKREMQRIHFVGIGGVGMSGLAEFLHRQGGSISGSDLVESATTRRLGELGLRVFVGHGAEHVADAEVLVASSAIGDENPEIREARHRGIPILRRGQMLADIMQSRDGIAVAGSHGKTTTTSLIDHVLTAAGLDPTSIIGGRPMGTGSHPTGTRMGGSRLLVAEADESDGSFLLLRPRIAVVTNIDPEHLDHYGDFSGLKDAFIEFVNNLPASGLAVLCLDHPGVRAILPQLEHRTLTYGFSPEADLVAEHLGSENHGVRFGVRGADGPMGDVTLPLPGEHNVLNALASIAVALELDVPFQEIALGLADFRGVERRYQTLGSQADIRVVDDYAHHPAELRATLAAARSVHAGRIVSIFQPHRYTRTRDCMEEFAAAFDDSDVVIVSEIFAAGDAPIPGVSGKVLAGEVAAHGHGDVRFIGQIDVIVQTLPRELRAGDLVLTLGAGDISKLGPRILGALSAVAPSPEEACP